MIRKLKLVAAIFGCVGVLSSCQGAQSISSTLATNNALPVSKSSAAKIPPNSLANKVHSDRVVKTVVFADGTKEDVLGWYVDVDQQIPWALTVMNGNPLHPVRVVRAKLARDGTVRVVNQWVLDKHSNQSQRDLLLPSGNADEFFFVRKHNAEGNWRVMDSSKRRSYTSQTDQVCQIFWNSTSGNVVLALQKADPARIRMHRAIKAGTPVRLR